MNKVLLSTLTLSLLSNSLFAEEKSLTVSGKEQLYYYSTSAESLFDEKSTGSAGAVTFDIKQKITETTNANFTAVGYSHLGTDWGTQYMEGSRTGGFFNVANITGNQGGISFVLGRQLLDTPMLGSFDWLLAPSAFEAYTLGYRASDKLSVVASVVNKVRDNNTGDSFKKLKDENYAVGVSYNDGIETNFWFYRVDGLDYSQFYLDASESIDGIKLSLQAVKTNYGAGENSLSYGLKASSETSGLKYSLALNHISDREAGMVGLDSIYTSSWNSFASQDIGNSWKAEISEEMSGGASATVSYADYETIGNEFDIIVGYPLSSSVSFDAIFATTRYQQGSSSENSLEFVGTYQF
jgi:hypothetical protein